MYRLALFAAVFLPLLVNSSEVDIPDPQLDVIANYCLDCHDESVSKGDLNLDRYEVDWTSASARKHWTEVYTRIEREKMPPKEKPQPSAEERELLLSWIDRQLMQNSPIGEAPMRRLNRREYLNTLKSIFPIPGLELPPGFPPDNKSHGFDTVSEALVISPSHLEAYRDTATMIADYLFPQPLEKPERSKLEFKPADMAISYSSAYIVEGAMRLGSQGSKTRNATWLSRFEAPASGKYQLTVDLSTKNPPKDHVPIVKLESSNLRGQGAARHLATFEVKPGAPQTYQAEVELYRGETVVFLYQNALLDFEDKKMFPGFFEKLLLANPNLAAAWGSLDKGKRGVPRGGTGWERLKEVMAANPEASMPVADIKKLAAKVSRNSVSSGETLVFKYFEEGPNIGIHSMTVDGPIELVEDNLMRSQSRARELFLGKQFTENDEGVKRFFQNYLRKAFRRPITAEEVTPYLQIVKRATDAGATFDDAMHLAIRTSLLSSNFLYKERGSSPQLDSFEVAARLAYFLTGSPPDFPLLQLAQKGELNQPDVLEKQVLRLIKSGGRSFAKDFTSLWLDTSGLDSIMPDDNLLKGFTDHYRVAMKDEVEQTFLEILNQNRDLTAFINPDFLYTNPTIGWQIYELPQFNPGKKEKRVRGKLAKLQRIKIPKGGRHGGLLGMPAVMMATANGVDTQPVLRGVWVLENIIGRPPPEAPDSVPALSPDLSGAKTVKERLKAHMADKSCASCHEDIDPVGFVLENFDAIGKWRTEYPGVSLPVETDGVLPGGTPLKDVTDLKKWLDKHPEHFANCLAEKLMVYGTGRILNFREKRIVEAIVAENLKTGNRFQDLIIALVQSEVFLTR